MTNTTIQNKRKPEAPTVARKPDPESLRTKCEISARKRKTYNEKKVHVNDRLGFLNDLLNGHENLTRK